MGDGEWGFLISRWLRGYIHHLSTFMPGYDPPQSLLERLFSQQWSTESQPISGPDSWLQDTCNFYVYRQNNSNFSPAGSII